MKKKILASILAFCLILSVCAAPASAAAARQEAPISPTAQTAAASDVPAEEITWTLTDGLLTISGQGAMSDYAPGEAPWAAETVYAVTIGDGVTHLGSNAFRGLEKLSDVTIGTGAATMGESVFADCPALAWVTFRGGNATIPANTFAGCTGLSRFWFRGDQPTFEPYSLSTGSGWVDVFYDTDNETWSDSAPVNLTTDGLGWGPYDIRWGESGTCGENVTWQILYNEMPHANSDILLISGTGPMDDFAPGEAPWLPYCGRVYTLVITGGVTAIGARAFDGQHFSEMLLSGSVSRIGAEAFRGLTSIWAFDVPESLRYIGERAFAESSVGRVGRGAPMPESGTGVYENCLKLETVDLPEGSEVIRERTFAGCTALKELVIPFTVTSIETDAFAGCTGLKRISFNGTEAQWNAIEKGSGNEALENAALDVIPVSGSCGDNAFWSFDAETGTLTISGSGSVKDFTNHITSRRNPWISLSDQLVRIVVEEGITRLGNDAFASLERVRSVSLPSTLTELGDGVFHYCRSLTGVEFPEALTTIGKSLFASCSALETFTVPETITVLPEYMFDYCVNLRSITLHDGVTEIGTSVFQMCESLTDVELPAGLQSLGGGAFFGCKSLTHLDWPEQITRLGGNTFAHSGLTAFVIPETVTYIGSRAFDGCNDLETLVVPDSIAQLGDYAFSATPKLTEIHIPSGITVIPFGCFSRSGITAAEIPEGVTAIEQYAFNDCPDLERVSIPETVTRIADSVFTYCSSLREVNWPSGVDTIGNSQFRGTGLTEFTVPATVATVSDYAFMDCPDLEKLVFEGRQTELLGGQIFANSPLLTIWCWYGSSAQSQAEFQFVPYVLFDPPADLPRYEIAASIIGDGAVVLDKTDSTGYEWITFELVPGPDSVPVDLAIYYYSYEELDLRAEQLSETTFRFLMPKCPVLIEAAFRNTITGFMDIRSTDFFYDSVIWAVENGITNGISATEFGPDAACNRAQVVTFLWRAEGCPEPAVTENPFVDVEQGSFYEKAVLWAIENGITNGTDATHFSPNMACNRATVVTFLYRTWGEPAVEDASIPFTDVPADDWYTAPVLWAVGSGITNGLSAAEFGPNATCNRAQVVTFLYRAKDVPKAEPPAVHTFELLSNDPDEEIGFVLYEGGGSHAAGERVIFCAEPWYGYLVEFTAEPADAELELYYLGAGTYELVMPAHDVVLTAHFVPAQGNAHRITTTCANGFAFADCDMDEDLNDIARPGEHVLFYIMPDEGFTFSPEGFAVSAEGQPLEDWWYLGELVEEDPELGTIDGIFLVELLMPDADVDITITCTAEADAAAAADVRFPVTVL